MQKPKRAKNLSYNSELCSYVFCLTCECIILWIYFFLHLLSCLLIDVNLLSVRHNPSFAWTKVLVNSVASSERHPPTPNLSITEALWWASSVDSVSSCCFKMGFYSHFIQSHFIPPSWCTYTRRIHYQQENKIVRLVINFSIDLTRSKRKAHCRNEITLT